MQKMSPFNFMKNLFPIKLKFGMQVPFIRPHAAVTFGNDPIIFSLINPTYQKVAYSEIFKLP